MNANSNIPDPALPGPDRAGAGGQIAAAAMVEFKSKNIFRASGLALLGGGKSRVSKDRKRIEAGQKLSPLQLVRDAAHGKVLIADGYHRLCAVYSFDEDAVIPCKIIWRSKTRHTPPAGGRCVRKEH